MSDLHLGEIGIWSREFRYADLGEAKEAASELEQLGYGALWVPGGGAGPLLEICEGILGATRASTVATGILNVWEYDPADVAAHHALIDSQTPGRFLLGIGIGHQKFVDAEEPGRYQRPLATIEGYLDELDRHAPAGTRPARVVAALAPRMAELAARRTLGVHPYMVPVAHTAWMRDLLGPGLLVLPELTAIVVADPHEAQQIARRDLELYLTLPNYTRAWLRLGYTEDDLADGGSARLVEALYAWGTPEQIMARAREHLAAGADHVCLRVVKREPPPPGVPEALPIEDWRTLAQAL